MFLQSPSFCHNFHIDKYISCFKQFSFISLTFSNGQSLLIQNSWLTKICFSCTTEFTSNPLVGFLLLNKISNGVPYIFTNFAFIKIFPVICNVSTCFLNIPICSSFCHKFHINKHISCFKQFSLMFLKFSND